jgi:hypothetical protein
MLDWEVTWQHLVYLPEVSASISGSQILLGQRPWSRAIIPETCDSALLGGIRCVAGVRLQVSRRVTRQLEDLYTPARFFQSK